MKLDVRLWIGFYLLGTEFRGRIFFKDLKTEISYKK